MTTQENNPGVSARSEFDLGKLLEELASDVVDTRVSASDRLATAAEEGADLSAAIGAMGTALRDEDQTVRVNMAWLAAFLSTNGLNLSSLLGAVILIGSGHPRRNRRA